MNPRIAIGIDVGGTAIKAGVVSEAGQILARESLETRTGEGPDAIIQQLAGLANRLRCEGVVSAIGVGMPGTLDAKRGIVHAAPNLPGWVEYPLVQNLTAAMGLPAFLENDANCAALGEYARGAGSGMQHMVLLTLGTGVGGGIILHGRLWRGADGSAGEWGHVIVQSGGRRCNCGQLGCLEAYASASNTALRAFEAVQSGRPTLLTRAYRDGAIESQDIVEAAQAGDELASEIWTETCHYLAVACINIQHSVNPQRIVLGGGMSKAGSFLLEGVQAEVLRIGSRIVGRLPEVRLATLGNDAGFVGAALNALHIHHGL